MRQTTLFLISFVFLLSACTVQPPDVPFCRPLEQRKIVKESPEFGKIIDILPNPKCLKEIGESSCGFCVWTISNRSQFVGEGEKVRLQGQRWSEVKAQAIIAPAESQAKIKAFVINACKQSGDCSKDIDRWRLKLDSLDSVF